jgi:hypothetical protein
MRRRKAPCNFQGDDGFQHAARLPDAPGLASFVFASFRLCVWRSGATLAAL